MSLFKRVRILKIDPNEPEEESINIAAELLRNGGLVVFPTETVYGLGANLLNEKAVNRVYKIKNRPKEKPLTIHIAKLDTLREMVGDIPPIAERFINRFWPGPLTIILNSKDGKRVGFRMPSNKIALSLIEKCDVPVVAPSANISGHKAPRDVNEVLEDLYDSIDMILDGGPTKLGIESTVVDATVSPYKVLREGAISKAQLKDAWRGTMEKIKNILFVCTGNSCRSIMAEGLLKKMLKDRGRDDIRVSSAGIYTLGGTAPAENTIKVMEKEGIDVSGHKTAKLLPDMIRDVDLILVMDNIHKDKVLDFVPEAKDKTFLLREYTNKEEESSNFSIPDPIGKPMEVYERVLDMIKESLKELVKILL